MNDEEISEFLTRSDDETVIFKDMDIKRFRDQKNTWQLSGRHGLPPQPLLQLEELPECYRNDDYFEAAALQEEELEGRGHRKRNAVSYNDGLSDDAWAMAVEGEEDIQDFIERSEEKVSRRAANKAMRDEGVSNRNSPAVGGVKEKPKKKKGSPPKNANASHQCSRNGKRKRGGKPVSVTPSVLDDDMDDDMLENVSVFLIFVVGGRRKDADCSGFATI